VASGSTGTINDDTHTGGTPHSVKVEQQPVGDVHERRGAGTPCREPLFDTRPRPPVRFDRRRTRPLGEFPGAQIAEPAAEDPRGRDEDALTGARPRTGQGLGGLSSSVPSTVMLAMATAERERSPPTTMQPHTPAAAPRRRTARRGRCRVPRTGWKAGVSPGTHGSDVTDGGGDRSPAEVLLGEQCQVACTPATAMSVATTNRGSAMRMTAASSRTTARPAVRDRIAPPAKPRFARGRRPRRHELAVVPGPGFGVRTHLA